MIKRILIIGILCLVSLPALADEGMWLPLLLGKKEADMKAKGMKITAKDIYDANNASLKDAIMLFGGGCTGEFVSEQGLTLTNHHCGYSFIVSHSTVERDYLTNGFWAKSKEEELPCRGLSVTLLVYMEDVTAKILDGVKDNMTEKERKAVINANIKKTIEAVEKGNHYKAEIEPFYYGNQYFMYVNEIFTDVRLVGAPPSNIGKFGGDTDNWMYPRHTGDFSVFRVYAGKDNKPAAYSKENVPYKPKKHLKISLAGVNEGDFTFVFGYPGSTRQFLTSYAVNQVQNVEDPTRIRYRTARLDIYNATMNQSPAQRLRYASQVASIANGWKKWQGEVRGLKRLNAIEKKQEFEKQFGIWANVIEERKEKYGGLLSDFSKTYTESSAASMSYIYFAEGVLASEVMAMAYSIKNNFFLTDSTLNQRTENLLSRIENLDRDIDRQIFLKTMMMYYNDYGKANIDFWNVLIEKKFKGNAEAYFEYAYDNSFLTNPEKAKKLLIQYKTDPVFSNGQYKEEGLSTKDFKTKEKNEQKINQDPVMVMFKALYNNVSVASSERETNAGTRWKASARLDSLYRLYVAGIMEMQSGKEFYPDANLTLRVTYGNVKSYNPKNAITYLPYTTIEGIMQKENPDIYDYVVESRLKDLYNRKDYGRYANAKGELPVCFIASNHTTGGNSGSPVLNADGCLTGLNFDRNWEGTMSDIMYDPSQCRNITLDIRYCLFIIDKFAGATNLISEMEIVK